MAKGARVLAGGKRNPAHPKGNFWEPTLLVDVNHTMRIMKEEHFGTCALDRPDGGEDGRNVPLICACVPTRV